MLSNDLDAFLSGQLEVRHVMTRDPTIVRPNQTVRTAIEVMEQNDVVYLLVCDEHGSLLGLLSQHYLRRSGPGTIRNAMMAEPILVSPDAPLNQTVTQMLNHGVTCIAVVEDEHAVGTLTSVDIQLTLQSALQLLLQPMNEPGCGSEPSTPCEAVSLLQEGFDSAQVLEPGTGDKHSSGSTFRNDSGTPSSEFKSADPADGDHGDNGLECDGQQQCSH